MARVGCAGWLHRQRSVHGPPAAPVVLPLLLLFPGVSAAACTAAQVRTRPSALPSLGCGG